MLPLILAGWNDVYHKDLSITVDDHSFPDTGLEKR